MPEVYENVGVMQNYLNPEDYSYPFADVMNSLGILSPSNSSVDSHMTSSTPSPLSISASPNHTTMPSFVTLNNAEMWGKPRLEIIEQPVDKFRFRYKSEMMGTHGSLAGASSSNSRKKQAPTVELRNHPGMAVVRCTLVTADKERRGPHAHRLVRRVGNLDEDDPHEIPVSPDLGFQASFHGMGIIHTAKKHIKDELVKKKRFLALEEAKRNNPLMTNLSVREETTIKMEAESAQKWMNLNSVVLCFQAFCQNNDGVPMPITDPVYSFPINNLKSALTGELKICRIDKTSGSCDGNDEIFMLVEKVGKKNIQIRFFEPDSSGQDDEYIWEDFGRFTELDVHHQYAIVFRTPPYRDRNITEPREVYIQLCRKSDGDRSEPRKFTYKPNDRIIARKRPRLSDESCSLMLPVLPDMGFNHRPVSDNSNISAEMKKLIDQTCHPNSDELNGIIDQLDSDYFDLLAPESDMGLRTDGPAMNKNEVSFAETTGKKIIKLIKKREPKSIDKILALLKERTVYGDSPLHSALRHGELIWVKCILMLLASNPEFYKPIINLQTSSGRTCLHYAVEQNQPEITKALLSLGADPNACDEHGLSPLHFAVKIPEAGACVDVLLEVDGINIEVRDDGGWSALHLAAQEGSFHAVKSLVKAKVDVNSTDMSYGRTALHIAVEGGHKEIVEFLLEQTPIDVNKQNFSGNTALHSAVITPGTRAKELCELLIRHKADPKIANNNRESMKESRTTTVKDEVESEEEDDEASGQTSFDLASNKPEILQLFSTTGPTECVNAAAEIVIKEELEDDQEESEGSMLDEQTMFRLVPILDKSRSWQKIATSLGYEFLESSLKKSPTSPSRMLLTYMDLRSDVPIEKLRSLLVELEEKEAVKIIDEMILRRNT